MATKSSSAETASSSRAQSSPYSLQSVVRFINGNFGVLLLILVFFISGFVAGSLWTENQLLKGGKTAVAGDPAAAAPAPAGPTGPAKDQLAKVPKVTDEDHILGNKNAEVVLIEYSDFECPFCQRFHPTMEQVRKEYGDKVAWVFRHYPLSFHPNAQVSAETSECVNKVGGANAFWKYATAIFEEQGKLGGKLNADAIAAAVTASGASASAVDSCVKSGEMTQKVKDQQTAGGAAGISGTPGTIVVTKKGEYELISGALPYEQVKTIIDKYL